MCWNNLRVFLHCRTIVLVTLFSQYLRNVEVPFFGYNKEDKCHRTRYLFFKSFPVSSLVVQESTSFEKLLSSFAHWWGQLCRTRRFVPTLLKQKGSHTNKKARPFLHKTFSVCVLLFVVVEGVFLPTNIIWFFLIFVCFTPWCSLFQVILAILTAWAICAILTGTDAFKNDPDSVGYGARTDRRLDVLSKASWFRFPYPGTNHCYLWAISRTILGTLFFFWENSAPWSLQVSGAHPRWARLRCLACSQEFWPECWSQLAITMHVPDWQAPHLPLLTPSTEVKAIWKRQWFNFIVWWQRKSSAAVWRFCSWFFSCVLLSKSHFPIKF